MSERGSMGGTAQEAPAEVNAPRARKARGTGLEKLAHDLRYRRRRFRQFAGGAFVIFLTVLARPAPTPFWTGVVLASLGMLVRMWASGVVMKNEVLATTGPYAYVRHPLYVGNLLICAGFCAASGVWWSVPTALVVLLLFYPETIRYEDGKLQRLFGEQWDRWAAETRALIPRTSPYRREDAQTGGGWSLRTSMVRNGEPIHVVVLGACLIWLFTRL